MLFFQKIFPLFDLIYQWWRNRNRPLAKIVGTKMSANTITILRSFLGAPIVVFLLSLRQVEIGFMLFVLCGLLDSFDGLVATQRINMGYNDDPKFGAFLDAFCDKIFWIVVATYLVSLSNYNDLPMSITVISLLICISLLIIETVLATVRVQDYLFEKESNESSVRKLRASFSGKLKFTLEMFGVGGMLLAHNDLNHWAFYIGIGCLIFSLPFAGMSLSEKLSARKPAS